MVLGGRAFRYRVNPSWSITKRKEIRESQSEERCQTKDVRERKTIDDRVVIKQTGTKGGREIIKKKVNKWH